MLFVKVTKAKGKFEDIFIYIKSMGGQILKQRVTE